MPDVVEATLLDPVPSGVVVEVGPVDEELL